MDYRVLLYYKYTTIDDPETFATEHLAFCKEHNLKGRILVSTEGINGTLSVQKKIQINILNICMQMNVLKI